MNLLRYVASVENFDPQLQGGLKDVFVPSKTGEYVTEGVYKAAEVREPNLVDAAEFLRKIPTEVVADK